MYMWSKEDKTEAKRNRKGSLKRIDIPENRVAHLGHALEELGLLEGGVI
jgi:hypothetical protein